MSSAVIRIQVATLSDVPDGSSRVDGVPNQLVTLMSMGSGSTHEMRFFDVANPGVAGATSLAPSVPALLALGDGRTWTFTPPGGATGDGQSFGIELIVDRGLLASEAVSRRKYAIPTKLHGRILPVFSEGADPQASLVNQGLVQVAKSVDNAGGNWRGFFPRLLDFLAAQEKQAAGSATILAGTASITVTLPLALDGKPAFAQIRQAADDATLTSIKRCKWSGAGVLTIYGNANATADTVVSYFVDGR